MLLLQMCTVHSYFGLRGMDSKTELAIRVFPFGSTTAVLGGIPGSHETDPMDPNNPCEP